MRFSSSKNLHFKEVPYFHIWKLMQRRNIRENFELFSYEICNIFTQFRSIQNTHRNFSLNNQNHYFHVILLYRLQKHDRSRKYDLDRLRIREPMCVWTNLIRSYSFYVVDRYF